MKKNATILLGSLAVLLSLSPTQSSKAQTADPIIANAKTAVVATDLGKVRGYIHNNTFTYKGIPYAQSERFMPPSKPKAWTDVRSSMTYGPVCPTDPTTSVFDVLEFAFNHNWGYTNENCQTLNVWTPGINDQKKRPVMVWLHGGGFAAGSAIELPSYDGENLSKKGDVVVVSVNHRLNILGFCDLSSFGEKYKKSANVGMMDIVVALEWVKANIANFGGDPNNVTIFGQSGGGAKVTTLMYAPSAKGLFHKAINQSGSYRTSFLEQEDSKRVGEALLEVLGLKPNQVDSLQKISYEKLNEAGKKAIQKVQSQMKAEGKSFVGGGLGWGPVHDGDFLPYQQVDPAGMALAKDIPLLIGSTKNEFMASLMNPAIREFSKEQAIDFLKKKYADQTDNYLQAVEKAYPNTTKPSDLIDIDVNMFRPGTVKHANMKSNFGGAPVYAYMFTWQSPVMDGMYKSIHCIDLAFVFNNIARCEEMTGGGKEAHLLADKMSQAWINFAKTGNPNHKGLPNWLPYSAEKGATMIFDNQSVLKFHHDKELLSITAGK
ncbi:carboxylesterase/lipase family protein [Flectobacillus major]|uniref:carboxylesterase/lipase family protein n=1 Tax=Flectobacillus major TaxID=103 RepID=UPI0004190DEA|nr:carboxylesterase family protein [Flectobacillus major]